MKEARAYLQKWNACSGLHGLQGLVGVGLKLRGVRLEVKLSFVNVHHEQEQSLSGYSLWSWELIYMQRDTSLHALTTEQRHAWLLKVFSVKCCVAKRVTTTLVHYIPLPKNEMVLDCTLVDIQTGHMRTFNLTSVKKKIPTVNLQVSCFYQALRRSLHWETKHVWQNCWADMSGRYAGICILSNSSHDATPDHSRKHASATTPVNKNKGASSYRNVKGQSNITRY